MARTYSDVAEPRYVERAKTADEAGTEVIANPTLVGTEDALESIQIDDTKYKVGGGAEWGGIAGTLADQTDLQTALDGKLSLSGGTMSGNITFPNNGKLYWGTNRVLMGSGASINLGDSETTNIYMHVASGTDVVLQKGSNYVNILDGGNTGANSTLAGTESNLTSLKMNGTTYKVLPVVTGSDVGKFLRVDANGNIVAETIPNANTASF